MRAVLAGVSLIGLLALTACDKGADKADVAGDDSRPAAAAKVKAPPGPPKQTYGQWEYKNTVGGRAMAMKMCVDARSAEAVSWVNPAAAAQDCSKREYDRQPDGTWTFYTVCRTSMGGETTSSGAAKGDFTRNFTVLVTVKTEGATQAAANGVIDMKIDASYIGPCPAGQRGGDVVMPGGQIMNVIDAAQKAGAAR
ncbi:MAG: DUF3617 family protein [Caulobacteraceae bacterium]|nr:MAG: DUF3617 family protein [Caulobacteraceae bacterium]